MFHLEHPFILLFSLCLVQTISLYIWGMSFDRRIKQYLRRRMCGIGEPLEHQAEGYVTEERGDFGRGVGVALCRDNITPRPFGQQGGITVNQDDGDFRFAELRKNL